MGYNKVIITGDFNCNILNDASLTTLMSSFALHAPNTTCPTHFSMTTSTLLDLFFVNDLSQVLMYDQCSAPCFSMHEMIFLAYDFNIMESFQTYTFRDYRNFNYDILEEKFFHINWSDIYGLISVDDQVEFLQKNILSLYNDTVPIRSKMNKTNTRPWFNSTIKSYIAQIDRAYSRWKRYKTPDLHEEYRSARRMLNNEINKTEYYYTRFSSAVNSKSKWKIIQDIV